MYLIALIMIEFLELFTNRFSFLPFSPIAELLMYWNISKFCGLHNWVFVYCKILELACLRRMWFFSLFLSEQVIILYLVKYNNILRAVWSFIVHMHIYAKDFSVKSMKSIVDTPFYVDLLEDWLSFSASSHLCVCVFFFLVNPK